MGYEVVETRIVGRVSRHNSPRDTRDIKQWNEFIDAVRDLAAQYPEIELDVVTGWPLEVPTYGE